MIWKGDEPGPVLARTEICLPIRRLPTLGPSRYLVFTIAILLFTAGTLTSSAQRYQVGDIVENFTLIDRATNEPVSLYDMEGKIIFLEWFAWWCPFCIGAASDIRPGIVEYYGNIGGNPNGIEIMHVGLNLQIGQEVETQGFINDWQLGLVLNDFDRAVASRFQPSDQPIFAIINGVAGSASHKQWELLYSELGYQNLNAPIDTFRAVINSVLAPAGEAPMITVQPTSQKVETGRSLTLFVTVVSELPSTYQWKFNDTDIPEATSSTLVVEAVQAANAGEYTVAVTNSNGTTTSEAATIETVLGFLDSLIAQDVPEEQRGLLDDPDRDGVANVYEFLSRTDANDPNSGEPPIVETEIIEGASYLVYTYVVDTEISSIVPMVQFSVSPAFDADFLTPVLYAECVAENLRHFSYRASTSLEETAQFARLQMTVQP